MEGRSSDIVKQAEIKAIQEVEALSRLSGNMITKGQVISKIHEINESIRGFDLVIESQTFRELARLSGVKLPRTNDSIYLLLDNLIKSSPLKFEEAVAFCEKAFGEIFSWDQKRVERNTHNHNLIKRYNFIRHDEDEVKRFARELIGEYLFHTDDYKSASVEHFRKTDDIDENFHLIMEFVDELGPLLTLVNRIERFNKTEEMANEDLILAVCMYVIDELKLRSTYFVDMIPTLMRAVVRSKNYEEDVILKMRTYEIIDIAEKNDVGCALINLARVIFDKDASAIKKMGLGEFLLQELQKVNFWEDIKYRPQLAMLGHIAYSDNSISTNENFGKKLEDISTNAGKLASILHT